MAGVAPFEARCDVAKILLDSGSVNQEVASKTQAPILIALIDGACITEQYKKEFKTSLHRLITKVTMIGLSPGDLDSATNKLCETNARTKKWKMQNYQAIFQYFTESEWQHIFNLVKAPNGPKASL